MVPDSMPVISVPSARSPDPQPRRLTPTHASGSAATTAANVRSTLLVPVEWPIWKTPCAPTSMATRVCSIPWPTEVTWTTGRTLMSWSSSEPDACTCQEQLPPSEQLCFDFAIPCVSASLHHAHFDFPLLSQRQAMIRSPFDGVLYGSRAAEPSHGHTTDSSPMGHAP